LLSKRSLLTDSDMTAKMPNTPPPSAQNQSGAKRTRRASRCGVQFSSWKAMITSTAAQAAHQGGAPNGRHACAPARPQSATQRGHQSEVVSRCACRPQRKRTRRHTPLATTRTRLRGGTAATGSSSPSSSVQSLMMLSAPGGVRMRLRVPRQPRRAPGGARQARCARGDAARGEAFAFGGESASERCAASVCPLRSLAVSQAAAAAAACAAGAHARSGADAVLSRRLFAALAARSCRLLA
jgi:hypothetical protein